MPRGGASAWGLWPLIGPEGFGVSGQLARPPSITLHHPGYVITENPLAVTAWHRIDFRIATQRTPQSKTLCRT